MRGYNKYERFWKQVTVIKNMHILKLDSLKMAIHK
jgi:hypothetical protein